MQGVGVYGVKGNQCPEEFSCVCFFRLQQETNFFFLRLDDLHPGGLVQGPGKVPSFSSECNAILNALGQKSNRDDHTMYEKSGVLKLIDF
jgi:hypothetical protein